MYEARGYISHKMTNGRSVPQSIQQQVIRNYCEKNGLKFLLSATEFEGQRIMLNSIKESVIVMYSIFQWPRGWKTDKDVRFAAENCRYTPDMDELFDLIHIMGKYNSSEVVTCLSAK